MNDQRVIPTATASECSPASTTRVRRLYLLGVSLAGLLLILVAPSFNFHGRAVVLAADEVGSSEMHVAIEHGLLALAVRDTPLADVLRAIGEEAGFKVAIHNDLSIRVTKSFAGVRLDKAIRRLVGDITMVMIYAPSRDEAEPGRLTEIRLYKVPEPRVAAKQQTLAVAGVPFSGRHTDSE